MLKNIKAFFAPPIFEGDPDKTASAQITNIVLIVMMFLSSFGAVMALAFGAPSYRLVAGISSFGAVGIWFVCMILIRRGIVRPVNIFITLYNFSVLTVISVFTGGITHPTIYLNVIILALATLLLTGWEIIIIAGLNVAAFSVLYFLETRGVMAIAQTPVTAVESIRLYLFSMVFTGVLLQVAAINLRGAIQRARKSEAESANTNIQLQQLNLQLEQRVQERTAEIEGANQHSQRRATQFAAIAQIGKIITSIDSVELLLPRVTNLISEQLGFYHVGIFLNNDENQFTVLRATNSEGGRRMLNRNHRLEIGQFSIVGYVANTGTPRIALDTGADAFFLRNLDLPETRSEMALPLRIGMRAFGVLDVQSTVEKAFQQEDVEILSVLADQISIAIENTRLLQETRRAFAEVQNTYRQYMQGEWQEAISSQPNAGYRYTEIGITPLDQPVDLPEIYNSIMTGQIITEVDTNGLAMMAIPVQLRGETIGTVDVRSNLNRLWNQDEIDIVQAAAEHLALALENARLIDVAQRRANKERTIGEISAKISAIVDVDALLKSAASEVSRVIPGADVAIQFQQNKE